MPTFPWTAALLHEEIAAWIDYAAHALPQPTTDPAPLTTALVVDALERRVANALVLGGDDDASLHLLGCVRLLRASLRLPTGLTPALPAIALEAAADLHTRALAAYPRVLARAA